MFCAKKIFFVAQNPPTPSPTPTPTPTSVPAPSWDIYIRTTENNNVFGFQIGGTDPSIFVDWGDGDTQQISIGGAKEHTYANPGDYTVKIRGSFADSGLISFSGDSFGNFWGGYVSLINDTSVIPYIPGLTNMSWCFGFAGLTSLPENLFANNPQINNFFACFAYCDITSIPENIFAQQINATDFTYTFYECRSLSSIPNNLFANNANATSFLGCFESCRSITSIPGSLFSNNILAREFSYVFRDCRALTIIGNNIFQNNINANNFLGSFFWCFSLKNLPVDLFRYIDYNFSMESISGVFQNIFADVTLDTVDYSRLLNETSLYSPCFNNRGVPAYLDGGYSKYNSSAVSARNNLINCDWIITDGGPA